MIVAKCRGTSDRAPILKIFERSITGVGWFDIQFNIPIWRGDTDWVKRCSNGAAVVAKRFRDIHLRSRKWPGCRLRTKALMVPHGADAGDNLRSPLGGFSVG